MRLSVFVAFVIGVLASVCADGANNNNESKDLEMPCGSNNIDVKCVREYFGHHGRCEVINHPDNEPVRRNYHVSYLPSFNTTVIDTQSAVKHLNGNIKKFYINKKTGNLVMSVYIKGSIFESNMTHFYFHRKGQEPLVLSDAIEVSHPPTDLTAVIPLTNGLITKSSINKAVISTYLYEPIFRRQLGSIASSKDPLVVSVIADMKRRQGPLIEEVFLTQGRSNFMGYLQKYVCDFKIPPS